VPSFFEEKYCKLIFAGGVWQGVKVGECFVLVLHETILDGEAMARNAG
jgi:hypothetical protein